MKNELTSPEDLQAEKIEFCKKLKQKRLDLNYTQEYMAEQLKVSLRTYQKIENNCDLVNYEKIAFLIKFINFKQGEN